MAAPSLSKLFCDLAQIQSRLVLIESLARDAHVTTYSPRRAGDMKTLGGYTPDSTGERASCLCEGTDPTTGKIVHVCSGEKLRRAESEIGDIKDATHKVIAELKGVIASSDHHRGRQGPLGWERSSDASAAAARADLARAERLAVAFKQAYRDQLTTHGYGLEVADELADAFFSIDGTLELA